MAILPYSLHLDRIVAHIHVHPALSDASRIAVLFILHGHPASAHHMKPIVGGTFDLAKNKAALLEAKRNLVIVTFDLEDDSDFSNAVGELEYESTQLYNKQERIASAVSELIDTLPAVLCPNNDRFIDTWMVAGLSLGAHAAWLSMDRDPRLSVCIPIIGSPDFLEIATARNNLTGLPLVSSYMTSVTRNIFLKTIQFRVAVTLYGQIRL
ncbi:alpha/beta hydrolase family protein [Rhizoctonia solani]|uniref:Alpha/beta hydrolase family protein n=1 Tax=Rhizoctonia solani TaxID=456999 RepID=A0A8H8STG5_9AGAM|nr:alpha/beta hydrolase family protein [Rhizoctonia solani]QRW17861.1 alpha/beta hydrolase family protein [Rhizoctonia solani]